MIHDFVLSEFAIFYKRLTLVEQTLKAKIFLNYQNIYSDNAYAILSRYFNFIESKYIPKNTFSKIFTSKASNSDKMYQSINKMYLSDVLNLFFNPVFLKNKVRHNFFEGNVKTNDSKFQRKQKLLKDFRNCIAHFNQRKYSMDKARLIASLIYFENLLGCSIFLNHEIYDNIQKIRKLSTNEIVSLIYIYNKNYFNNDKLLIMAFDDIALMNGYTFANLPQRWTIIRLKFAIQKRVKQGRLIINPLENIQIKLF